MSARAVTTSDEPSTRAAGVENYTFIDGGIKRTVFLRSGLAHTTAEPSPSPIASDAHVAYQSAMLRCTVVPPKAALPELSIADLFAGCGGLTVGAHEAARAVGYRPSSAFAIEMAEAAATVFADNFRSAEVELRPIEEMVDGSLGDKLTASERKLAQQLDGLSLALAGPPCQGNSDLNNHTRRNDPKNALYLRAARFVEVVRPSYAVIENVPGVAHDRGGVVGRTVSALIAAGYHVSTGLVSADALGAAQRRRRHLLVATRVPDLTPSIDQLRVDFAAEPASVMSAIGDLGLEPARGAFGTPATHSVVNQRRISYLFDHELYELPNEQRPDCHRLKAHSYVSVYGRMYPDLPAPTITAGFGSTGQGRFVHPLEPRTLTPHEAARVQGFPDWFSFSAASGRRDLQKMIGNAVPTRLAYAAVASLLR